MVVKLIIRVLKEVAKNISWMMFMFARKAKTKLLLVNRHIVKPKFPENADGKILIHLGCGNIDSPEFINVDGRLAPHVHLVRDVIDLSIFPDKYADLVYACHVLEHIRHDKLRKTLWEWRRILKPEGILRLSVPNFEALLDIYRASENEINSIAEPLMGGQDHALNIHYSVFNLNYLSRLLIEVGFRSVREWDPEQVNYHNFEDWASKTIEVGGNSYQVSLNVEAVK